MLARDSRVRHPERSEGSCRAALEPFHGKIPRSLRSFGMTYGHAPRAVPGYRCSVTPTCRHISSTGQVEHFGSRPVQTCFPNGTSSELISTQ